MEQIRCGGRGGGRRWWGSRGKEKGGGKEISKRKDAGNAGNHADGSKCTWNGCTYYWVNSQRLQFLCPIHILVSIYCPLPRNRHPL